MTFAAQLSNATRVANDALNTTWKRAVVQTFTSVQAMTPVLDNVARPNWQIGQTANSSILDRKSIEEITSLRIPDVGGFLLLYNNVPYVRYLEDGTSKMKAVAMVATNVAKWPATIRSNRL